MRFCDLDLDLDCEVSLVIIAETGDAEDHPWMISAVVTLWNGVELLVAEDSSAEYVRLVNELRGGENSPGPARAPSDRGKALEVVEKAELALEALGSGKNFTTAALQERLEEIRSELLGVLAECNVTEDDMRYAQSRT